MTPIQGGAPLRLPPRLFEVWEAVRDRLRASVDLEKILSPDQTAVTTDRVILAGTPDAQKDRPAGASDASPWGMLWIVPITTLWNTEEPVGRDVVAPFLVRVDFHVPKQSTFPLQRRMEAAHEEAFRVLHGWRPSGLEFAEVHGLISRSIRPEPMPLWDEQRGLWYLSATYTAPVAPVP